MNENLNEDYTNSNYLLISLIVDTLHRMQISIARIVILVLYILVRNVLSHFIDQTLANQSSIVRRVILVLHFFHTTMTKP